MTIEEALNIATKEPGRIAPHIIKDNSEEATKYNAENIEALNFLVMCAKKYQKIEQILKDIPYGGDVTVRRIQEVLEN